MNRPTDSGTESTGKALPVMVVDINSERSTFHIGSTYSSVHSCVSRCFAFHVIIDLPVVIL